MAFMRRLWDRVDRKVAAWERETAARLEAVRYGEKSLLAFGDSGECFQIIDVGDAFLFVNTDGEHYITDFDPVPEALYTAKDNFLVPKKEITSIDIGVDYADERGNLIDYAVVKVRRAVKDKRKKGGKTRRSSLTFVLTDDIAEEALCSFFTGAAKPSVMSRDAFEQRTRPLLTPKEKDFRRNLFTAVTVLPIASVLSIIGACVFSNNVATKCCTAVCALVPFVLLVQFFCLPDWLVLRREGSPDGKTIDLELPLGVTAFASGVLTGIGDMRFYNWPVDFPARWLLIAAAPFALFAVLLFLLPSYIRQWDGSESLYRGLLLLVYAGMACLSGVYLLNYALDFTLPRIYSATVAEKSAEDEGTRNAQFVITTRRSQETYDVFEVTEEHYERLHEGDTVTVALHDGGLGIPYATMDEGGGKQQ